MVAFHCDQFWAGLVAHAKCPQEVDNVDATNDDVGGGLQAFVRREDAVFQEHAKHGQHKRGRRNMFNRRAPRRLFRRTSRDHVSL